MVLGAGACHRGSASASPPRTAPGPTEPADPAPSRRSPEGFDPGSAGVEPRLGAEAPPVPRGVTGTWAGTYFYTDSAARRPPVYFFAELILDEEVLSGFIVEPNTFGDSSEAELHATVSGVIHPDGLVSFHKTYDGTAGVSHLVRYEGQLDDARTRIEGQWMVSSGSSGTFVMTRQARRPGLAAFRR